MPPCHADNDAPAVRNSYQILDAYQHYILTSSVIDPDMGEGIQRALLFEHGAVTGDPVVWLNEVRCFMLLLTSQPLGPMVRVCTLADCTTC